MHDWPSDLVPIFGLKKAATWFLARARHDKIHMQDIHTDDLYYPLPPEADP